MCRESLSTVGHREQSPGCPSRERGESHERGPSSPTRRGSHLLRRRVGARRAATCRARTRARPGGRRGRHRGSRAPTSPWSTLPSRWSVPPAPGTWRPPCGGPPTRGSGSRWSRPATATGRTAAASSSAPGGWTGWTSTRSPGPRRSGPASSGHAWSRRRPRTGWPGSNGSSTDVGMVGYTLGGGLGPFARTHGYAADHVRRMEVVTGDGASATSPPTRDPELFRALLGGKDVAGSSPRWRSSSWSSRGSTAAACSSTAPTRRRCCRPGGPGRRP